MAKKIIDKSKTVRRVVDTGPTLPRVDPKMVAEALGAEEVTIAHRGASPISMAAVGQEIAWRLRSTGGRPALEGATRRQKIPVTEEEWEKLVALSESLSNAGVSVTPGQLASVLLHVALEEVDERDLAAVLSGDERR